jgi:hypothetical protein
VQSLRQASRGLDLIVASRASFPQQFAAHCRLKCMPPNEAVALLRAAGADQAAVSDEQAGRIAELCGFNALELSLVGSMLGSCSCTAKVSCFWGWETDLHGAVNAINVCRCCMGILIHSGLALSP